MHLKIHLQGNFALIKKKDIFPERNRGIESQALPSLFLTEHDKSAQLWITSLNTGLTKLFKEGGKKNGIFRT